MRHVPGLDLARGCARGLVGTHRGRAHRTRASIRQELLENGPNLAARPSFAVSPCRSNHPTATRPHSPSPLGEGGSVGFSEWRTLQAFAACCRPRGRLKRTASLKGSVERPASTSRSTGYEAKAAASGYVAAGERVRSITRTERELAAPSTSVCHLKPAYTTPRPSANHRQLSTTSRTSIPLKVAHNARGEPLSRGGPGSDPQDDYRCAHGPPTPPTAGH
jgi:hypothetical protein